jgi:hypothetical protein
MDLLFCFDFVHNDSLPEFVHGFNEGTANFVENMIQFVHLSQHMDNRIIIILMLFKVFLFQFEHYFKNLVFVS